MKALILRNNFVFYPLVLAAWATFILVRHMNYSYYSSPLPSAVSGPMAISDAFYREKVIDRNIEELRKSLSDEELEIEERGHVEHNIGTAYYDRYRVKRDRTLLDSAQVYYERSLQTLATVPRFYYNLGRIFTERRQHMKAKEHYEKALSLDSTHVLSLHNLALLNFYELGEKKAARRYLQKALGIRSDLPICNYVLGEIALQEKNYQQALQNFRQEVNAFSLFTGGKRSVPVSKEAMRFAASKSHLELAVLYSTRFTDAKAAQANFHAFLRLEPDQKKREAATAEMRKYWVVKSK